jgi:hypothetical protein
VPLISVLTETDTRSSGRSAARRVAAERPRGHVCVQIELRLTDASAGEAAAAAGRNSIELNKQKTNTGATLKSFGGRQH